MKHAAEVELGIGLPPSVVAHGGRQGRTGRSTVFRLPCISSVSFSLLLVMLQAPLGIPRKQIEEN